MPLITCPDCGKEISDRSQTCSNCGRPVESKSRLILYGYTQWFATESLIGIYINNAFIGNVGSATKSSRVPIVISIPNDCILQCTRILGKLHKPIVLQIHAGKVTEIWFRWNRMTGGLETKVIESDIV